MNVDPQWDAELRRRALAGQTSDQIAEAIGWTKESVVSRIRWMGIMQESASSSRSHLRLVSDCLDIHSSTDVALKTDGAGNRVNIGAPLISRNFTIDVGGGAEVHIAPGCVLQGLFIYARAGAVIRIGGATGFNGTVKILAHERSNVSIGEACLFADGVHVTVSDMHSIIDQSSGERINPAANVTLGNHVWLGQNVLALKGATIGSNSIIGAASVVTGALPADSLCVGAPARAIRHGVTWRHELV